MLLCVGDRFRYATVRGRPEKLGRRTIALGIEFGFLGPPRESVDNHSNSCSNNNNNMPSQSTAVLIMRNAPMDLKYINRTASKKKKKLFRVYFYTTSRKWTSIPLNRLEDIFPRRTVSSSIIIEQRANVAWDLEFFFPFPIHVHSARVLILSILLQRTFSSVTFLLYIIYNIGV